MTYRFLPTLPMEQIISDYESGMTMQDLEKKYGFSDTTIEDD